MILLAKGFKDRLNQVGVDKLQSQIDERGIVAFKTCLSLKSEFVLHQGPSTRNKEAQRQFAGGSIIFTEQNQSVYCFQRDAAVADRFPSRDCRRVDDSNVFLNPKSAPEFRRLPFEVSSFFIPCLYFILLYFTLSVHKSSFFNPFTSPAIHVSPHLIIYIN